MKHLDNRPPHFSLRRPPPFHLFFHTTAWFASTYMYVSAQKRDIFVKCTLKPYASTENFLLFPKLLTLWAFYEVNNLNKVEIKTMCCYIAYAEGGGKSILDYIHICVYVLGKQVQKAWQCGPVHECVTDKKGRTWARIWGKDRVRKELGWSLSKWIMFKRVKKLLLWPFWYRVFIKFCVFPRVLSLASTRLLLVVQNITSQEEWL